MRSKGDGAWKRDKHREGKEEPCYHVHACGVSLHVTIHHKCHYTKKKRSTPTIGVRHRKFVQNPTIPKNFDLH